MSSVETSPAPVPVKFMQPEIRIGQPGIVWFPTAQKNDKPVPCVVCDVNGTSTISIAMQEFNSTIMRCKQGVHHIDDPYNVQHAEGAARVGAWGFYEDVPTGKSGPVNRYAVEINRPEGRPQTEFADRELASELEKKIMDLHHQGGLNAVEIAHAAGGGCNFQKVNAVLKKYGCLKPGDPMSLGNQ